MTAPPRPSIALPEKPALEGLEQKVDESSKEKRPQFGGASSAARKPHYARAAIASGRHSARSSLTSKYVFSLTPAVAGSR